MATDLFVLRDSDMPQHLVTLKVRYGLVSMSTSTPKYGYETHALIPRAWADDCDNSPTPNGADSSTTAEWSSGSAVDTDDADDAEVLEKNVDEQNDELSIVVSRIRAASSSGDGALRFPSTVEGVNSADVEDDVDDNGIDIVGCEEARAGCASSSDGRARLFPSTVADPEHPGRKKVMRFIVRLHPT